MISVANSQGHEMMTIERYSTLFFGDDFDYDHRGNDVLGLVLIIIGYNIARALALSYLRFINR